MFEQIRQSNMKRDDTYLCKTTIINYERVDKVKKCLPSDIKLSAEVFKVLSDPTRLKIVLALLCRERLCVCDLAAIADITVSGISHQLRLLKNMKLVSYIKEGKMVYYSLNDSHVVNVLNEAVEHIKE